jgi:hypothetical protein
LLLARAGRVYGRLRVVRGDAQLVSQLHLAVLDAGDAGAAIGACVVPRATTPKAGRSCAVVRASDDSGVLDRVSVFAETGAATALAFARHTTTMANDVSGRRALEQAAKDVTNDFAALQHCLGKS